MTWLAGLSMCFRQARRSDEMPDIAIIGAGSVVFTRRLLGDLLSFPALADSHIRLMDIDAKRLELIAALGRRLFDAVEVDGPAGATL